MTVYNFIFDGQERFLWAEKFEQKHEWGDE